jgi:hypothetical protein
MQHLDEGTIHSLLDGALSADHTAQVEAHIAECPQCAAAVAEARGFIAASSRILTALDHVPRGVVPAATQGKWYNRAAWRAAAVVLVVAVGSLVVVRNSEDKTRIASGIADSARVPEATVTQPQMVAPSQKATDMRKVQAPAPALKSRPSTISSQTNSSGKAIAGTARPNIPGREESPRGVAGGSMVTENVAPSQPAAAPTPQPFAPIRLAGATAMDAAREELPLKVVDTLRTISAKVTLYEVAPGDTVTFTEPVNVRLEDVVTTSLSSAQPLQRRTAGKSAAPAISAPVPPVQVQVANGVNTISWPDPTNGNTLKLSGRMPVERLEAIRRRIERERAAAATKKSP